jgi:CheY-like chemotaxis protein
MDKRNIYAHAKILIVDDQSDNIELLERILRRAGYTRFRTTTSPRQVIPIFHQYEPDIILLDLHMAEMNGLELLQALNPLIPAASIVPILMLSALKSDLELKDIPVIIITVTDDKEVGYALGASEFITKPVDRNHLSAILKKYRKQQPSATVLIIEDDPAASDLMRSMVLKEGWEPAVASNGNAALEQIIRAAPNIILLHLMMPDMDGFEFVMQLRTRPEWSGIPIIVVTAKDLTAEDRLRLHGRVENVIQKGAYSMEELLLQISKLLQRQIV